MDQRQSVRQDTQHKRDIYQGICEWNRRYTVYGEDEIYVL
jgi:hypothetical protein